MMSSYNVNEILWSLSTSIDYVGITDIHHGKRVAYFAAEINKLLGLDYSSNDIVVSGLLHDCGVHKSEIHESLVNNFEPENSLHHCEQGARLIAGQPLLRHLQNIVRHHHTPWENLSALDLAEKEKNLANLIFLCDRLDVLFFKSRQCCGSQRDIIEKLRLFSGKLFSPLLIEALLTVSSKDAFWYVREIEEIANYFRNWHSDKKSRMINDDELESLSFLFSQCVDAKSAYTAEHSIGTRNISLLLAESAGIGGEAMRKISVAALLHDLGKLRVPDYIIEKNTGLDENEFGFIKRHSYDSMLLLANITGFGEISKWAGRHHEKLNGSGYPYRLKGDEICLESRIIAISDIFQALIQKRPYRKTVLRKNEIISILREMRNAAAVDGDLVHEIVKNYDEYEKMANLKEL